MKLIKLILTVAISVCSTLLSAQVCNQAIMFIKGASYELETYSGKDKKESKLIYNVKDITKEGTKYISQLHTKILDSKDKLQYESDMKTICDGDKFYIDMSEAMKNFQKEGADAYEMKMENVMMEIPHNPKVGESLPDAISKITMIDKKSKTEMMQMTISTLKRKIASKETLVTPAGSFDCYKISYETVIENNMLMLNMKMPSFTYLGNLYYNQDVGMVKSEDLNKEGNKVKSYTILTKYTKP